MTVPGADGPVSSGATPSDGGHARIEALARVRALLLSLGCADDEIDRAVEDGVIDLLVVDRVLVPSERLLTLAEVSDRTGLAAEDVRRFWRALGFLDVEADERSFSELDVEAIQIFQAMVAMGMAEMEVAVQMARVIGTSMARVAGAGRRRRNHQASGARTPSCRLTGNQARHNDSASASPPTWASNSHTVHAGRTISEASSNS